MLHLLPDDVLQYNLRPYLTQEDALNVLDVLKFKVPFRAPLVLQVKMNALLAWTNTRINFSTNPKTAERVVSTMETFVALGRDVLRLQPTDRYMKWKTKFIETLDLNIELLRDHWNSEIYMENVPNDDLSLAILIDRIEKIKVAVQQNETYKHRRRTT